MNKKDKIYIAGSNGMVGSGIIRKLQQEGFTNLIFHTSKDLDLRNQLAVKTFFENEKPDYVILAAAKVGGIFANNKYRAEFIYDNLMIESNVIHFSYVNNVKKLLFLGSSCIYPKFASQPLKEEYLLSGFLEFTNQPYAIAKIAGIEMCDSYRDQYGCNFISAMPTNLYGTNDNYHPMNSHVLPALIRKIILAKKNKEQTVTIWGTGKPFREFLHVDDLADACLFLINNFNDKGPINVGFGEEISIENLAIMIAKIVDYHGDLIYDTSKPDGTTRKIMDITKIKNLGWSPKTMLYDGVSKTINEAKKLILENDY